jgi:uncharacterized protein YaeQ
MDPGVSKFTNRLNLKGYDVLYAAVLLIVTDHLSIWIERRQYRLCAVLLYNGLLLFFGAGLCAQDFPALPTGGMSDHNSR